MSMKKEKLLVSAVVVLLLTSCGKAEEKPQENMRTMLEHLFETVSEKEYASFEEPVSANGNQQIESQEIPEWAEERFSSCVSETCFEKISGNGLLMIPLSAYEAGKELSLEELEIQSGNGYYEFQGMVGITGEGKTEKAKIHGSAQTDEEGKVSDLKLSDPEEILEKIRENQ